MFGHPETPIFKDPNNAVAGYFLNGTQYNDTAVLYVASFANENYFDPLTYAATFANTTQDFFAAVKAANKTKLVIDLSGNGGGNTLLPNDLVSLHPSLSHRDRFGTCSFQFARYLEFLTANERFTSSSNGSSQISNHTELAATESPQQEKYTARPLEVFPKP